MRLFRVKLNDGGWDTYDSAIIACKSKAMLEELFENGDFNDCIHDSERVQYDYRFYMVGQTVKEIECIGSTIIPTDKDAIVILSSFNSG